MNKPDEIRLRPMLEAAEEALTLSQNGTRADFEQDRPALHIFVRLLTIIGEAASRIDPEFRITHPQIAWRNIIAMRNRLIHEYFDIDIKIVWKTVVEFRFIRQVRTCWRRRHSIYSMKFGRTPRSAPTIIPSPWPSPGGRGDQGVGYPGQPD